MDVRIRGAKEHNLKHVDIDFGDGLTVVTGVSGSGKTSLVFDTLYHEAHRRFLDVYLYGRGGGRLAPAKVETITGLGPTIAVGQNLLNRNPNSTLATASGLHPFFRLLYTNFGERFCLKCGEPIRVLTADEILEHLAIESGRAPLHISVPLVHAAPGSHQTLLSTLAEEFGAAQVIVDGRSWDRKSLDAALPHSIEIKKGMLEGTETPGQIREFIQAAAWLGADVVRARGENLDITLTTRQVCTSCNAGLGELRAAFFNQNCPYCTGKGCRRCDGTGMHPQAASVRWQGKRLPAFLSLSVDDAKAFFSDANLPSSADRLKYEINRRLEALERVGLGYLALDRAAPSLSRGESQRVRLAISLSSRLEDILHVLDEPTIGQHPADVSCFMPAFRDLPGPVIYVEHDRTAAASADRAVDLGPAAGIDGGRLVFQGTPKELWAAETITGRYFSLRERVMTPTPRPAPNEFLEVRGAQKHNLQDVDVKIPLGRLTVIAGVSGSGKSTLVEHVLVPSLTQKMPTCCTAIEGPPIKPVLVDQSPIGRNPRSNPATYTKLADAIRDLYANATGLSKSHFSFNRPEGACPVCKGIGAGEVKMRYLPSIWLPCETCEGQRFKPDVLRAQVDFAGRSLSVADLFATPIREIRALIAETPWLSDAQRNAVRRILRALTDVGLGYLALGQPSPTLSGGEAQRVKLSKYLGRGNLAAQLLVLDEPSTGLHPQDLDGLLVVLDRLVRHGATIVVVEHNTDFIRAADWIIDLGPGAGPAGGQVLFQGPPADLMNVGGSLTGQALKNERDLVPIKRPVESAPAAPPVITIRHARANNLKGVNVEIPKGKLTVVTGVSGSGKSTLVGDVLQTEARRRYLESLSMYERQGLREGAEAPVDSITGLGVTLTLAPQRAHAWSQIPQFTRRSSIGALTEISFHLANLLASLGARTCLECGEKMVRDTEWRCPNCGKTAPFAQPRQFSSAHWSSSCKNCSGLGTLFLPEPDKLIVNPDKPLCAGAMYSPGYWPQSYLCKDQPIIAEIGKHYGFDPQKTPWVEMSEAAQQAFLFGDDRQYTWTYISKGGRSKGQEKQSTWTWRGFYGEESWIFDWDVHGTYTRPVVCPECGGAGLRPEYLAVTLQGRNMGELGELPLAELEPLVAGIILLGEHPPQVETSLQVIGKRLRFLRQVGLGYLHLDRPTGSLSAGEAQRIQLASLLGSELTTLTILVDEPSRGLHPRELEGLREALVDLRDEGNTVIVVEHDPVLIRAADHIIDLGPGAGAAGGQIVAQGTPAQIAAADTLTGEWLRGGNQTLSRTRRKPRDWMAVRGARENNLRGVDVRFPLGMLTGVCGVSGSGKSTLLIDTLGRALVRKTHTSSFSREPLEPGAHDDIENAPGRTFLVDQSRHGIHSPAKFLGLHKPILKLYADSDDALAAGFTEKDLSQPCSACRGRGVVRLDMGFLPDEQEACEICKGTGFRQEAWEVRIADVALPEINALTIDEVHRIFQGEDRLAHRMDMVRQVGLGYLVWNQPSYTLSGGELQRLKIAKELIKKKKEKTLYILDEPTVGLHMADVARLIDVLERLAVAGHTVLVVEHHPHLLSACDWLIELGPGGGPQGGLVIAAGTPEDVSELDTPTAPYLRELLETAP